jgi:putative PIN family toxin of toxin-antitoxin system
MPKVVVDTNVYISAFNFGGVPLEILVLGIKGDIDIFISSSILEEIKEVLPRDFKWSVGQTQAILTTIKAFTQSVDPQEKIDLIKEDEPDNRILECAVEARADIIITGNRHILNLGEFRGITIQKPRGFLESEVWLPENEK